MYQKLEEENGNLVPFEFVKSIGQNICPINTFGNQEPTANMIASVSKQGPIYVRAKKKLKLLEIFEDGDDEEKGEDELEAEHISSGPATSTQVKTSTPGGYSSLFKVFS